jgi:transcription termination factor Rho
MLSRDELVHAIAEAGGAVEGQGDAPAKGTRRRRRGTRERRGRRRERIRESDLEEASGEAEEPEAEEKEAEPVSGVLDVMPQRYGFLRLSGLEPGEGDVYISASQIRRCELRSGDEVAGPARDPRRGERHRALVHVDRVNGAPPGEQDDRLEFDELTPVPPSRRLPLDGAGDGDEAVLLRAADLLAPFAFGERVLIWAAPRSGRTTLLRSLAKAVDAAAGAELVVLLVDERPEEATRWRRALPDARLAIATAEMSGGEQAAVAELALARAKRLVEAGADVVLIVDSLSRLATARGRVDAAKALFGAGRDTEEEGAGSLTVVATVFDDDVGEAVRTTESALVSLDPELAAAGVVPALDVGATRVSGEEELRDEAELEAARRLRGGLAGLEPVDAARALRERIEGSSSNADLLRSI